MKSHAKKPPQCPHARFQMLKIAVLILLLALLPALHLLYIFEDSCDSVAESADTGDRLEWGRYGRSASWGLGGRVTGERLLASSFDEDWDSFHYRDPQPNGSSCAFMFDSLSTEPEDCTDQSAGCISQFDRVCLTRKDPHPPPWNHTSYETGRPFLELSHLPFECVEQQERAKLFGKRQYGTGPCGRCGKRLPVRVKNSGMKVDVPRWKPRTFIIYCAQEGCDFNLFHSIALAYFPTYVALQKLGLKNLEGIHIEFYECQSGKPNEVKTPEMIATATERHTTFLQAFKPASITFLDIDLQAESQHLGCYEQVTYVGQTDFPWHCKSGTVEEDPLLTGFANLISESLGLGGSPALPAKDHLLYFKRKPGMVRQILNSDEVEKAFGMEYSVYVGPQSAQGYRGNLIELLREARGASVIFGMHGAGLANAIFAPRNVVVIEVVNCFFRLPLYRNLAVLTGKFYIELVVNVDDACKALAPDKLLNFKYHGDHVIVLLNDLAAALDQAKIILHRVRSSGMHAEERRLDQPIRQTLSTSTIRTVLF